MSKSVQITKLKNQGMIVTIAALSAAGFAGFTNADILWIFKAYGLLFTCQIGFLIFFLNQIYRNRSKAS
jgi:hypothetical protein